MDSKQGEKRYYQVSFAVSEMHYVEAYSEEEAVKEAWRLVTKYPNHYVNATIKGSRKYEEIPAFMR